MNFSKGFTLVELLVVIVIVGVMALVILPNFTTGSDGARLRTAARGVAQMTRYARTMAVLYQTPMDLVISSGGELRVERRGGGVPAAVEPAASPPPPQGEEVDAGGGKGYEMAELNASKVYERIAFRVSLDQSALGEDEQESRLDETEAPDDPEKEADDPLAPSATVVRIPFESNGRCLPFVVKVQVGGEDVTDEMAVAVDRFGMARIMDGDE
jgi:type II secretion system protein H